MSPAAARRALAGVAADMPGENSSMALSTPTPGARGTAGHAPPRTCERPRRAFPAGRPRPTPRDWLPGGPWAGRGGAIAPRRAAPPTCGGASTHPARSRRINQCGAICRPPHRGRGQPAPYPHAPGRSRILLRRQRQQQQQRRASAAPPHPQRRAAVRSRARSGESFTPGPAPRRSPCPARPGADGGPTGIASQRGRRQSSGAPVPAPPCRWGTS